MRGRACTRDDTVLRQTRGSVASVGGLVLFHSDVPARLHCRAQMSSTRLGDFPTSLDGAHVSLFTPATVPGRTAEGFDVKRRGELNLRYFATPS